MSTIPVLLYHHVSPKGGPLCVTPQGFGKQMRVIRRMGFETIFFKDILGSLARGARGRALAITFDDGYLDNWVYAYPYLAKYRIRATVFVPTSQIADTPRRSPNLLDVWQGSCGIGSLPETDDHFAANQPDAETEKRNYLSWTETREMSDSGIVDVQSHGLRHVKFFASSRVLDINFGQYWWLPQATGGDTRIGIPVYESKSSLATRRYFDDPLLREHLTGLLAQLGGRSSVPGKARLQLRRRLLQAAEDYTSTHKLHDSYEEEKPATDRIREELASSKEKVEKELGRPCTCISYPWGHFNEQLEQLISETGYQSAASMIRGVNAPGTPPLRMRRAPVSSDSVVRFATLLTALTNERSAMAYFWIRRRKGARPEGRPEA